MVLVSAQIALAVVLMTGAALLGRSTWRLLSVSPGFNPENLLTMRLNLPGGKYDEPTMVRQFHEQLLSGYPRSLERRAPRPSINCRSRDVATPAQ